MLNQFKSTKRGTYGEYIIDDYKGYGFRIVTIATEFPGLGDFVPGDEEKIWGPGVGFWQVDYPVTSYTFWKLMEMYTPIAVMTTSRAKKHKTWLLEIGSKNLKHVDWSLLPWNVGRRPFKGGDDIDPAKLWGPNAGHGKETGDPPDATEDADFPREVPADIKSGLLPQIEAALNAEFADADLDPKIALLVQGINADDKYVSAYAGYHAVWYDAWKASCKVAWHTHVDFGITLANASKAMELQLEELIAWLLLNVP